jgi:hypothetical protein
MLLLALGLVYSVALVLCFDRAARTRQGKSYNDRFRLAIGKPFRHAGTRQKFMNPLATTVSRRAKLDCCHRSFESTRNVSLPLAFERGWRRRCFGMACKPANSQHACDWNEDAKEHGIEICDSASHRTTRMRIKRSENTQQPARVVPYSGPVMRMASDANDENHRVAASDGELRTRPARNSGALS